MPSTAILREAKQLYPIQSRTLTGSIADSKIVAVLRGKSVTLARPETILQPGDRLLLIAPAQAREELAKHLASPSLPNPQIGPTGAS